MYPNSHIIHTVHTCDGQFARTTQFNSAVELSRVVGVNRIRPSTQLNSDAQPS